ncbi:MAG: hypothetical protein LBH05_07840 [Deferribacteraceae bacterium]|jgi:hypothetical protein|nr:hypothetical protein [Deferribacteraceae bacterium]
MTDLYEIIKKIIRREFADIHTVLPAKVTKVNETTINCQPVINRVKDDESIDMPEFAEVPLMTLQGGGCYIQLPVAVGDYCLLLVSERCCDRWYKGQDNMPPLSGRMFDYSDCFAVVGINPENTAFEIPEEGEIIIKTKNGDYVKIKDGDIIDIYTKGKCNIKADGDVNIETAANLTIGDGTTPETPFGTKLLKWLNEHQHISGAPGAPTSPAVTPATDSEFSQKVKTFA